MCGRFARFSLKPVIIEEFGIAGAGLDLEADYNIAPGTDVAAVIGGDARALLKLRWGLIPSWSKDPAVGSRMINARAETVREKPSFRPAFRKRRCLVIADGFYEWKKDGRLKLPYYITMQNGKPFGMAGLYEQWVSPGGKEIKSCTIITTEANGLLKPVHDRMPVIVRKSDRDLWLDAGVTDDGKLSDILRPYDPDEMVNFEVGIMVNSPKNNSPECIAPVHGER